MHITHAFDRSRPDRGRLNLATLIVAFCVTIALGIGGHIPTIGLTSAHAAQCNGECEFSDEEAEVFTAP